MTNFQNEHADDVYKAVMSQLTQFYNAPYIWMSVSNSIDTLHEIHKLVIKLNNR